MGNIEIGNFKIIRRMFLVLFILLCNYSVSAFGQSEINRHNEIYIYRESLSNCTFDYNLQVKVDKYKTLSYLYGSLSFLSGLAGMYAYDSLAIDFNNNYKLNAKDFILSLTSAVVAALPCAVVSHYYNSKANKLLLQAKAYATVDNNISQKAITPSFGISLAMNF